MNREIKYKKIHIDMSKENIIIVNFEASISSIELYIDDYDDICIRKKHKNRKNYEVFL